MKAGIIAGIEPPSSEQSAEPPARSPIGRRVVRWVGPENPAGVVYGVILIGALMAAEAGLHDGYPETVGSAVLGIGIYWLAHSYSTMLGERLSGRDRLTRRGLARALAHDWAIVRGAVIPLLALLIAWVSGAPQSTGASIAVWAAIGCLVGFELLAGSRDGTHGGGRSLEAGIGIAMGLAILALKALSR